MASRDYDGFGSVPADPGCLSASDTSEVGGPSCGLLGVELLPLLLWASLARRRRR